MGLVWLQFCKHLTSANPFRTYREPSLSEFNVVRVEAYNGIKEYLSELSGCSMTRVEDIIIHNEQNRGTEGAWPGDHPAFASGQVWESSTD